MRCQTDLNVTSFAHLTAAVLRAFLCVQDLGTGGGSHAAAGHRRSPSFDAPAAQTRNPSTFTSPASPPPQRAITIVNISSVSVDQPYEYFALYGMGKAARHMIIRSVAHEASLREAEAAAAASGGSCAAVGAPHAGAPNRHGGAAAAAAATGVSTACARVRALSYAPGAIDTEMQASAREALPAGRLKAKFEENAREGRLVDPRASAAVLYDILTQDTYDNGAHRDYYSAVAGAADAVLASHPLAYGVSASSSPSPSSSTDEAQA
ncbi:hypothetical protein GPECTOR_39g486 [Gonium pectorale]|uniref:Uncharacterized protein n=1 Tax=Gonium pectorale TaxID=33097 RepID=A0A150GAX5_GONPE|nr:hypothetical protein GPECTOR_39g486 [Gonium pectorale]|eukprot:KXZ46992.1 hypothetical protein GPECTOR_39g486 [Gonium pectorale]